MLNLENVFWEYCKKITNIIEFNGLKKMKNLTFNACPNIKNFELKNLPSLECLEITDCKDIKSIEFVENLPSLKKLILLGSTNVLDSNLKPAQRLEEVIVKHRNHYNVKIKSQQPPSKKVA